MAQKVLFFLKFIDVNSVPYWDLILCNAAASPRNLVFLQKSCILLIAPPWLWVLRIKCNKVMISQLLYLLVQFMKFVIFG